MADYDWGWPKKTAALIDRVIHHADVLTIEGESYRRREAEEAATTKWVAPSRVPARRAALLAPAAALLNMASIPPICCSQDAPHY